MSNSKAGWKILAGASGLIFSSASVLGGLSYHRHSELVKRDGLGFWERHMKEFDEHEKTRADVRAERERWASQERLARDRIQRTFDLVFLESRLDEQKGRGPWAELERDLYDLVKRSEIGKGKAVEFTSHPWLPPKSSSADPDKALTKE